MGVRKIGCVNVLGCQDNGESGVSGMTEMSEE
jgi:hypothetical protein